MNTKQIAEVPTSAEDIKSLIEKQSQILKDLRAKAKELKVKEPKALKGRPVEFETKSGQKIRGNGQLYYVVNLDGKLYYKQADSVTLLDSL